MSHARIDGGAEFRHVRVRAFRGRWSLGGVFVNKLHLSVLTFAAASFVAGAAAAQGDQTTPPPPNTTAPTTTSPQTTAPTTTAPTSTTTATTPSTATTTPSTTTTTPDTSSTTTTAQPAPATLSPTDEVPALLNSTYSTPQKDKTSKEKPKEKLRWAGTSYFQQVGVSPDVVAPGLVQTYAPVADTFMLFNPRYALTQDWQLRARMTANYEFTDNANSTTTRSHELVFGDILPEIDYRGIPALWGIKTIAALGSGIPTSPASQARTMITSPFAKVTFDKSFDKFLGGELELIVGATYSHPLYRYTTAQLNDQPAYAAACYGAGSDASCANQASGAANVENSLTAAFIATAKWGKWSPTILYYLFNQWTYQFQPIAGVVPEPNGSTNFRQSSYFNAALDYEVNDWFTAEIGYQMYRTILTGESTIGNPFWDPYQDMRVYLGVNIALDSLYEAIQGKKDEEGILRTKNERRPTSTF